MEMREDYNPWMTIDEALFLRSMKNLYDWSGRSDKEDCARISYDDLAEIEVRPHIYNKVRWLHYKNPNFFTQTSSGTQANCIFITG